MNNRLQSRLVVLAIVAFVSLSPLMATTYYVSISGNNANGGASPIDAWATPGYGSKQMKGGDTLVILSGTYRLSQYNDDVITPPSGSVSAWTVIRGSASPRPILQGKGDDRIGLLTAVELVDGSYISIENLVIESLIDQPYSMGLRDGVEALSSSDAVIVHDLAFKNLDIHNIEETALNVAGNAEHLLVRGCHFHNSGGSLISSAHHDAGAGWRDVWVDSCMLEYAGYFYQGKAQHSQWDRPDGFGIEISEGPVTISYTTSQHNLGDGLDSKSKRTYIHHCIVANITSDGIKLWGDSSRVENTLVYGHGDGDITATTDYASITLDEISQPNAHFELTNVTVDDTLGNIMYAQIDPAFMDVPISITIRNCIFSSRHEHAPITFGPSVTYTLENDLFYFPLSDNVIVNDTVRDLDSNAIVGFGTGNRYGDPRFIRTAFGSVGDYHLRAGSPAINSGSAQLNDDLDGYIRPNGSASDIGCYEYIALSVPMNDAAQPSLQTCPNPVIDRGTIRFAVPQRQHVRLELYDALGRSVKTIFDGEIESEEQSVPFDVKSLSPGVYFVRLEGNGSVATERVLVLTQGR